MAEIMDIDNDTLSEMKNAVTSAFQAIKKNTIGGATKVSQQIQDKSANLMEKLVDFFADSRLTVFVAGAMLGIGVGFAFVKFCPWAYNVVGLSQIKGSWTK